MVGAGSLAGDVAEECFGVTDDKVAMSGAENSRYVLCIRAQVFQGDEQFATFAGIKATVGVAAGRAVYYRVGLSDDVGGLRFVSQGDVVGEDLRRSGTAPST